MYKFEKPFVIILLGTAGVGKSTLAEFLKNQISNTAHVSVDHIKRYISEFREVPSHNQISRNITNAMIDEYLENGINVIVDQGMNNEEIEKIKEISEKHQTRFFVYRIEADSDIRLQRLKDRAEKTKQLIMSKETMDILLKIYNENTYPSITTFDSGKLSIQEIASSIIKDLLNM
jgi:adenylate kinase family enzyme